jgi:uncharacterized protein YjdB
MTSGEMGKCRICGGNNIFAKIQIKVTFIKQKGVTYKRYSLSYCYGCWKDSLGEYILDQLELIKKD